MSSKRRFQKAHTLTIADEPIVTFRSVGDVDLWLLSERQALRRLQQALKPAPYVGQLVQDPDRLLNNVAGAIEEAKHNNIDDETVHQRLRDLARQLDAFASADGALSFSSPEGEVLCELAERDPHAAALRCARKRGSALHANDVANNFLEVIYAAARDLLDGADYKKAINTQKSQLTRLRHDWNIRFLELDDNFARDTRRISRRFRAIRRIANAQFADQASRMNKLETTFSTEMKLGAGEHMGGHAERSTLGRRTSGLTRSSPP